MKQMHPSAAIFQTYILRGKFDDDSKQIFTFAHVYFDCAFHAVTNQMLLTLNC